MFVPKVLVGKLSTVDALAAGSVVIGEVAPLKHKPRNDTVKAGALVPATACSRVDASTKRR